jgi:pimeloyl-ACP methyl ester carboxylesterase
MKIYLIPGLGYDCRIFEKLAFANMEVRCLKWIEPRRQEALGDYALRLFQEVPMDEDLVLIGHSLGGIIAQELAAKRKVQKIILVSSVQSRAEIPFQFKVVKRLGLYRLFTKELSVRTVKYWGAKHGIASTSLQDLFKSMVNKHSNAYLQWALKALSAWQSPDLPTETKLFQIHGTDDQTFPIELIKGADVVIQGGTHVMIYSEAEEITEVLIRSLTN